MPAMGWDPQIAEMTSGSPMSCLHVHQVHLPLLWTPDSTHSPFLGIRNGWCPAVNSQSTVDVSFTSEVPSSRTCSLDLSEVELDYYGVKFLQDYLVFTPPGLIGWLAQQSAWATQKIEQIIILHSRDATSGHSRYVERRNLDSGALVLL